LVATLAESALFEIPPSLKAGPSNQTVAVGQRVTFSASALYATTYQWDFAGHKIAGATNATYVIASAKVAQAGLYSVTAINSYGRATSGSARLVVDVPPQFTVQPASQNGIAGRSVTLSAHASGSTPLAYQWEFDGGAIKNAAKAILVLTDLQTNAAGLYAVIASNAVGSATSHVATLTVIVPPSITSQPASVKAVAGSSVTFTVVAEGTAPLHYQWERDGAGLTGKTNSSLTLPAVKSAQAGKFRVLVRNLGGSVVSSNAVLTVK
jgi:plastocyanin